MSMIRPNDGRLASRVTAWLRRRLPLKAWFNSQTALAPIYDGTLAGLAHFYLTDPDSTFQRLRECSKTHDRGRCRRLVERHGPIFVRDLTTRTVLRWREEWAAPNKTDGKPKVAMAHSMVGILRTLINFGATVLDNDECLRVSALLHKMRVPMAKPRTERLTSAHAIAIRAMAHRRKLGSIALAQAFQTDCFLRQKDVIGEHERGEWMRGLRWEEIDADGILRHVTSKRGTPVEIDLKLCPMVMEEVELAGGAKQSGPVIISERTGKPFSSPDFRRQWRAIADAAGVPKNVRSMDSRAGAISEASDAGAALEEIRHAAAHRNSATTARYSRNPAGKTAEVMRKRNAHRAAQPSIVPSLPPTRERSNARRKASPSPRRVSNSTAIRMRSDKARAADRG